MLLCVRHAADQEHRDAARVLGLVGSAAVPPHRFSANLMSTTLITSRCSMAITLGIVSAPRRRHNSISESHTA